MNKLFLLLMLNIIGCAQSPKNDSKQNAVTQTDEKLQDFSASVFNYIKENKSEDFLSLFMAEKNAVDAVKAKNAPAEVIEQTKKQFKESGLDNKEKLLKEFNDLRKSRDENFWQSAVILEYQELEENKDGGGFSHASPVVIIKHNNKNFTLRIGEVIKFDKEWKLLRTPFWY